MMAASTAMSVGGGMISRNEANSSAAAQAAARQRVLRESLDRQSALGKEAGGIFKDRMKDYGPGAQKNALADSQASRTADITSNIEAPPTAAASTVPLAGSAPAVVKGEIAKRMLASFTAATDKAKALGKLGGYSDNWMNNGVGVTDASRRIGTINNFSRGEAAILPGMQDLAQAGAVEQPSIWGPLLTAGGSIMSGMAGKGGAFASNPFGATSTPIPPQNTYMGPR